jgi:hypothetical protein
MRTMSVILTALAGLVVAAPAPVMAQEPDGPPPWCLPSTDSLALRFHRVAVLGGDPDEYVTFVRKPVNLPPMPPDSIVLVDDEPLCQRASEEYDRFAAPEAPKRNAVYLIRYGSFFLVFPPKVQAGDFLDMAIFDRRWRPRVGLLW